MTTKHLRCRSLTTALAACWAASQETPNPIACRPHVPSALAPSDTFLVVCFACVALWLRRGTSATPPGGDLLDALDAEGLRPLVRDLGTPLEATLTGPGTASIAQHVLAALRAHDGAAAADLAHLPGMLVQAVIPARARKAHGEFYTPYWLVDHVLKAAGWPHALQDASRLVDPTCGAGAFLVGAIAAVRSSNPSAISADALLNRIAGFDLNPVAVLATRVALLAAVRDLLRNDTVPALPAYVRDITAIACNAPCAQADVVVGNPPWVRWSDLDPHDQPQVAHWARHYGLAPRSAFHGGSEVDLAAVVTYRALDSDLRSGGTACLVLPATLLRAPAAAGFRRMVLRDNPLRLDQVDDFGALRAFGDAATRTAVLRLTKDAPACFPAPAVRWTAPRGHRLRDDAPWDTAQVGLHGEHGWVSPVGEDGRLVWMTDRTASAGRKLHGPSAWLKGRKGITTDLNGAYFVRVLGEGSRAERLLVANDVTQRGQAVPSHTFEIERALVFPLLKGAAEIRAYRICRQERAVIVPNRDLRRGTGTDGFRAKYPLAHEHFSWVEDQTQGALTRRSTYRRALAPTGAPFFSIYNVGPYTFTPYKVVWAEIATAFRAALCGPTDGGPLAQLPVVPDHKVYFVPVDNEQTGDFLCALLNSKFVREFVDGATEKLQVGTLFGVLELPRFDASNEAHVRAAGLAAQARREGCTDVLANALEGVGREIVGHSC